jgi:hypothetical protein
MAITNVTAGDNSSETSAQLQIRLQIEEAIARQEEAKSKARQEEAKSKARQEEAKSKARQEEAKSKARQEEAKSKARQEEAKVKQEEAKVKQEEQKTKQEEQKTKQEEQKTKQLELQENRKKPSTEEIEGSKRKHILSGQSSSSMKILNAAFDNDVFLKTHVRGHIQDIDIEALLNDNINIKDDMMDVIEKCFHPFKTCDKTAEDIIQDAFGRSINNVFDEIAHLTSLKYVNTSHYRYLKGKAPDCGFLFKNINIIKKNQTQVLTDFIVCAGEFKTTDIDITKSHVVGQLSRYLYDLLIEQKRDKIYGFLTNTHQIKFYCLEKVEGLDLCDYYESKPFQFFTAAVPETSSSSSSSREVRQTANVQSKEIRWNTDTLKIFMKFLTMNWQFYGCSMLNISPYDDLNQDEFNIGRKSGSGLTSTVYGLNRNTNVNNDTNRRAIKIAKRNEYSDYLKNEVTMLEQLKQSEDSINFKKYFENIFSSSPTGKFS